MYLPFETTSSIFIGGMLKWVVDRLVARKKLSPAGKDAVEQRGTLLASGFIAGEAIMAIILSVAFILADQLFHYEEFSLTWLLTRSKELFFFGTWGGWLSLVVFGVVAYTLVRVPFRKGLPE
jgi:hypothetical protein